LLALLGPKVVGLLRDAQLLGALFGELARGIELLDEAHVRAIEQLFHGGVLDEHADDRVEGVIGHRVDEQVDGALLLGGAGVAAHAALGALPRGQVHERDGRVDARLEVLPPGRVLDHLGRHVRLDHEGRLQLLRRLFGRLGLLDDLEGLGVAGLHRLEAERGESLGELIGELGRVGRALPPVAVHVDGDEDAQRIGPRERAPREERAPEHDGRQHGEHGPEAPLGHQELERVGRRVGPALLGDLDLTRVFVSALVSMLHARLPSAAAYVRAPTAARAVGAEARVSHALGRPSRTGRRAPFW
jgi:hypothetical protein